MAAPSNSFSASSSSSARHADANMFVRMPRAHGVRRRREDSTAVEIEELDSRTMRQNSYNYFQQHGAPLLRTSTFRSSLGRSPASRKRQRTLAEQLDELCLQGAKSRNKSARRQARDKARQEARIVELDELGREKVPSMDSSGSDSDDMMDTTSEQGALKVYGDVADTGGLRSSSRQEQGNSTDPWTRSLAASFAEDLPAYLSLTPHEFENLSMAEKRQWYQAHRRYMRELDQAAAEQKNENERKTQLEAKPTDSSAGFNGRRSSSASSSRSYQVPSTDEDDEVFDDFGEDVEMMEDIDDDAAPKCPHAAGALTHTEWFIDDEL
ncbi:uncharacterized protein KRP23_10682 [Phytophthora ramorum]|uniref:uncharacterized protein n=1 Tax=Phytophthora ramorum TaxID=164328 RepID=UPI0030A6A62C|nr:hypothetical protein KRP23_10682 [Phytophthora ramorum]